MTGTGGIMSGPDGLSAPASYAQQRVWLSQQVDGTTARYNVQAGLRFHGHLDRHLLNRALTELTDRQAALRTSVTMRDGDVVQIIAPPTPVEPDFHDLTGQPDPGAELGRRAQESVLKPLDVPGRPPICFELFRLAPDDHVVLMTMDHLMADPWSASIMHEEIGRAYGRLAGVADQEPEPAIQYADYAMWQHDLLAAGALDGQIDYWRGRLGDDPPRLALPSTGHRKSRSAATVARPLPADLTAALAALGRGTGTSLFMALLTGYAALLGRYAGQDDVVLGTLTSGRTMPETERLVGFFANLAVLRMDLSGAPTYRELLNTARGVTLDAYANQDVPFQHLVSTLRPSRHGSDQPYFDTLLQLADLRRAPIVLPGLRIESYRAASQPTPVDLAVTVLLENDRAAVVCEYDTGLFSEDMIRRALAHYELVLAAMVADPDARVADTELLTDEDRRWLAERSDPRPEVDPGWTVAGWFADTVARFPTRVAVDSGDLRLTYTELNARANRVAHALRARGVGPETLVGILLERGLDLVTCVLGVLKAGGAYIPLDPAYPADRVRYMVADACPAWVISSVSSGKALTDVSRRLLVTDLTSRSAGHPECDPPITASADNLGYVIYTSGSTGRPKGAAICQRGMKLLADALREVFGLTADDRVLQLASPSFDASVWEFMWAFGVGAALCVPSPRAVAHGDLAEMLRIHRPTALITPPAVLSAFGDGSESPDLRVVVAGGEACTPQLAAQWSRGRAFFNAYGPTEATVWSTVHAVAVGDDGSEMVPIGRPIPGVVVEVLDARGGRRPVGLPGELYVGGPTVGRGYLGRPGLTADRYVPDPYTGTPGGRLYRTGDLVRWRTDGALEFLGRIDRQVKLRGFRIELGEIEARLSAHPAVRDSLVILREDTAGLPVLAAYALTVKGAETTAERLRDHCAAVLPAYMVPAAVVLLDRFPLSPNGKIDQRALPVPEIQSTEEFVAPRTSIEQALAAVWCAVLGCERVSVSADFFEIGGDSLAATRVVSRMRRDLGLTVSTQLLFDRRTLAEFAAAIAEAQPAGAAD